MPSPLVPVEGECRSMFGSLALSGVAFFDPQESVEVLDSSHSCRLRKRIEIGVCRKSTSETKLAAGNLARESGVTQPVSQGFNVRPAVREANYAVGTHREQRARARFPCGARMAERIHECPHAAIA